MTDRATRIILPVGPTGQFPIFLQMVMESKLSLRNCHFFFMDEYCYEDGTPFGLEHPLGFRSTVERLLFDPLEKQAPELMIPREQIYFPDPGQPERTQERIDAVGGIDTCYGGIGIHGHVAFNEPEEGVENSETRVLRTNPVTKTINMIRSDCGGFFGDYPEVAVTIGMKQILQCKRIVLFPRNDIFKADGTPFQYANTIVRLAVAGGLDATPAGDYPATFCGAQKPGNPDRTLKVYTTKDALEPPRTKIPPIEG
jgi:glucosamine-6-phosphate deaminase